MSRKTTTLLFCAAAVLILAMLLPFFAGMRKGSRFHVPQTQINVTSTASTQAPSTPSQPVDESSLPQATLIARGIYEMRFNTGLHDRLFQISKVAWALDQETGIITFTSPDGLVATSQAQIVGSYNAADGTWLWAWENPSVYSKLAVHAKLAREYGQRNGIADLTTAKLYTTEEKCWEFTAITYKLGKSQGAYRGPAGDTKVFITFGEVTLSKAK